MTRTVLKVSDGGRRFVVTFTTGTNNNPYGLYELTTVYNEQRGYNVQRRRIVERYQNLQSCIYWLCSVPEFKRDWFVAV